MQFTIENTLKGKKYVVEAEESVTPGLLITEDIVYRKSNGKRSTRYQVTHAGTTMKITHDDGVSKRRARLIAGALGGLPIDWTMASQDEILKASRDVVEPFRYWLTRELRE